MSLLITLAIISSLLVITASSTVLSIIWLVLVFLLTALVLSILGLTYAALTYVLVYVGAIAILFLFVVQLLDQRQINIISYNNNIGGPTFNLQPNTPFAILIATLVTWEISTYLPIMTSSIRKMIGLDIFDKPNSSLEDTLLHSDTLKISLTDILHLNESTFNPIVLQIEDSLTIAANLDIESYLSWQGQIVNLGEWLYGPGSLPLMIMSIILLLAMAGPIVLCWRPSHN